MRGKTEEGVKRSGERGGRDARGPRGMSPYLAYTGEFAVKNAFRNLGRVLTAFREFPWDLQTATLENPKSGMKLE